MLWVILSCHRKIISSPRGYQYNFASQNIGFDFFCEIFCFCFLFFFCFVIFIFFCFFFLSNKAISILSKNNKFNEERTKKAYCYFNRKTSIKTCPSSLPSPFFYSLVALIYFTLFSSLRFSLITEEHV